MCVCVCVCVLFVLGFGGFLVGGFVFCFFFFSNNVERYVNISTRQKHHTSDVLEFLSNTFVSI